MYRIKLVKSLVGLVIGFFIIRSVILPLMGFRGEETEIGFRGKETEIFSTLGAFAALKEDGSVVTWGYFEYGGDK